MTTRFLKSKFYIINNTLTQLSRRAFSRPFTISPPSRPVITCSAITLFYMHYPGADAATDAQRLTTPEPYRLYHRHRPGEREPVTGAQLAVRTGGLTGARGCNPRITTRRPQADLPTGRTRHALRGRARRGSWRRRER